MDPKLKEELLELADKAENCVAASSLPLPPTLNIDCLRGHLKDIAYKLRELTAD